MKEVEDMVLVKGDNFRAHRSKKKEKETNFNVVREMICEKR